MSSRRLSAFACTVGFAFLVVSVVGVTTNLVTFGNLGSLRGGLHQIGYGLGQTADILARDAAATMAGVFGKFYVTTRDVLNVATFGQVASLGDWKPDGSGTTGKSDPLGAIGRLLYGALVPCYGNFNGTGWGVPLVGLRSGLIINQGDIGAYTHDQKPHRDWQWIRDQWTTNPQAQWVGPVGAAFALLGTIPFGIRGAFQDNDRG